VIHRQAALIGTMLPSRRALISRIGGCPNRLEAARYPKFHEQLAAGERQSEEL